MLINRSDRPSDRLIVALDVPTAGEARRLVEELDGVVSFYKVGYQLFLAEGMVFVRELVEGGKRVFLDLKLNDIDETIANAAREVARNKVSLLTLYGNAATVRAAVTGRGSATHPRLLSVTLLSSADDGDLADLRIIGEKARFRTFGEYIAWRAATAIEAGADGLIASGSAIGELRKQLGSGPIIVSPGIRPSGSGTDDHKRSSTPREAIAAGADYLVVGRPIRNARDRRGVAGAIIEEIQQADEARV